MDTPLRRLSGGSRPRFHILLQNLHFKLSLVESNQINHIGFWKFSKKVLRALNNQSCKEPFFYLLRHRKFQKLRNSLVTLHSAKNRLYFFIVWYIRGLESISILICVYSEARHFHLKTPSFLKSVRSTLSFFLGRYFSSPDQTIENSGWSLLIRCSKA